MPLSEETKRLTRSFFDLGAIKFGAFRLKLHEKQPDAPLSPIYANLRTADHPKNPGPLTNEAMDLIGDLYEEVLDLDSFDCFADIPEAGTPFGDQVERVLASNNTSKPRLHLTKAFRDDGSRYITAEIEGNFKPGDVCLLVDDLITGADTKLEAIRALEAAGLVIKVVLVVLDRQQGGVQQLEKAGYEVVSILELDSVLDEFIEWARDKVVEVREYMSDNQV
jgi:uridine monophosphate synthetase